MSYHMAKDSMLKMILAQDLSAHYPPLSNWTISSWFRFPILRWQRRLRRIESYERLKSNMSFISMIHCNFLRFFHKHNSVQLGFSIPPHVFGPGLSIAHWGTIAVEQKARIGKNCRIHQGVTIGSSKGQVPIIGDDCFIGANAVIIGGVQLGNNVKVGASAVVTRSFGDGAVLVGNPARDISDGNQA